jgi:outer membrane protein TolC
MNDGWNNSVHLINKHSIMKTLFWMMVFSTNLLLGQPIDYNIIILPEGTSNVTFEERLVQLAWKNNPLTHIANGEVNIAQEDAKVIGSDWATRFGVVGNLNEFNIKEFTNSGQANNPNQFFPRYNVYVQLPLSLIVQAPHQKRAARYRISAAEEKVNLLKLEIRSRVLKLYSEYKKAEIIWLIRKQSMADDDSNFLLIEQKFKNGDATIDEYIRAQRTKNDMRIQLAITENEFKKAKFDIEEVIGVKLEDVK